MFDCYFWQLSEARIFINFVIEVPNALYYPLAILDLHQKHNVENETIKSWIGNKWNLMECRPLIYFGSSFSFWKWKKINRYPSSAYEDLSGFVHLLKYQHIFENIHRHFRLRYQVTWKIVHLLFYTWKLLSERLKDIQKEKKRKKNVYTKSIKYIYIYLLVRMKWTNWWPFIWWREWSFE